MSAPWIRTHSSATAAPATRSSDAWNGFARPRFRLCDEAARLVPNQPWGDIRGMGNRLRHAYDRLSLPVIWHAIQDELPTLEADVRLALIEAERTGQN